MFVEFGFSKPEFRLSQLALTIDSVSWLPRIEATEFDRSPTAEVIKKEGTHEKGDFYSPAPPRLSSFLFSGASAPCLSSEDRHFHRSAFSDKPSPLKRRFSFLILSAALHNLMPFSMGNKSTSSASKTIILEKYVATDKHNGVTIDMKEPMDSKVFASMLKASLSSWREQGKRGVWIKLPIALVNLVEPAVKQGFRFHHAEPDYLMLALWIPDSPSLLPLNASHRVVIGAFVMNDKREVLVVKESNGRFKGTDWKLPTGVVNEGEDICAAAIREVKEETGIDAEFLEVLAFRQNHKSFFRKSDLFFLCMLRPRSFDIQKQDSEIECAQWMAVEVYASGSFEGVHEMFGDIAKICLRKSEKDYPGFSPVPSTSSSGKATSHSFGNRILFFVCMLRPLSFDIQNQDSEIAAA